MLGSAAPRLPGGRFGRGLLAGLALAAWAIDAAAQNVVSGSLFTLTSSTSAPNGAWCWFEDERVIIDTTDPARPLLLASTISAGTGSEAGDVDLLWRNLTTGSQGDFELANQFQQDDHNNAALYRRPDGRYLAMYSRHGSDNFTRWRISTNPGDPTAWGSEQTLNNGAGTTYNNVYHLPNDNGGAGRTYNFTRATNYDPTVQVSTNHGTTWTAAGKLLTEGGSSDRPYVRYNASDERIFVFTTDRHPRNFANSIYSGYVQNGVLHRMDGSVADASVFDAAGVAPSTLTRVFANGSTFGGTVMNRAWTTDLEVDATGNPVGIFTVRANDSDLDHRFFYSRFDGREWRVNELAKAGGYLYAAENDYTGLASIDPENPNVVYLSTKIDPRTQAGTAKYELYKGFTSDFGASWAWTPLTVGSTVDNLRPAVPKWNGDSTAVLWMRGTYATYTSWDTELVGMVLDDTDPKSLLWKGGSGHGWDVGTSTAWDSGGGSAAGYRQGDEVAFDDSAASANVAIAAPVNPMGVAFANRTASYVVTGSAIGGSGGLRVIGGGSVTLANAANTFTGDTLVARGTLALAGSGGLAGSRAITVATSGTLDTLGLAAGGLTLTGQALTVDGRVVGDVTATAGSSVQVGAGGRLSGALRADASTVIASGTVVGNVSATRGATLQVGGTGISAVRQTIYVDATHGSGGNTTLASGGVFSPTTNPDWQIRSVFGNGGVVYQGGADSPTAAPELRTTISGLVPGRSYQCYVNFWDASGSAWRILAGGTSGRLRLFDSPRTGVTGATDGLDPTRLGYGTLPVTSESNRMLWAGDLGRLVADAQGRISIFVDDTGTADGDDRTWFDGVSYVSDALGFTGQATLAVQGNVSLDGGAALRIDLGSPTATDRLSATGTATLGGAALVLALAEGYDPAWLVPHTILTAGTVVDSFARIDATGLAGPKRLAVSYTPTAVTVTAAMAGDGNLDGVVDLLDVAGLVAAGQFDTGLSATWADGDFSGDGLVDLLDAADFLTANLFDAGPYATPAASIAPVPEPGPLGLAAAAAAAAGGLLRRRGRRPGRRGRPLACEPLEGRRMLADTPGLTLGPGGSLDDMPPAVSAAVLALHDQTRTLATLPATTVTMTGRSELFVTGTGTPLAGSVIHLNSADAWLFLPAIKPSVVSSTLLGQVFVNGAAAVSGTNVRVVQYGVGTVVIPHAPSFQPLTGFTGPNFTGSSRSFGLYAYHTTDATLGAMKGDLSSFTLKRGYMATIATSADGSGTSKVYVAQDHDLEIAILPAALDNRAQFIRVLPWRWVAKKGASDLSADVLDAAWRYNWNNNLESTLDWEYVPIKQQAYWPALPTTKQNVTHLLGFNEPNNPVEDAYSSLNNGSVDAAIAAWPSLLATGHRIGSPAVTDGGKAWLYEFMDKAIAANLRVDFIAIHNYQAGHTASSLTAWLKDIYDRYQLPIWVKEFNNGANWTTAPDPTLQQNADWVASITDAFDTTPWIERYSIYSAVEAVRQMVDASGNLTPAGLVYKNNASPIGYVQEPSVRANSAGRSVAQLPLDGTARDTSGHGNNGQVVGGPAYVAGRQGQALQFDGTSTFVALPANVASGTAFTFAAWVYRDGGGNWQRIFDFGDSTSSYLFLTPSNGSRMRFAIRNGGAEQIVETDPPPIGQWTHVAVTLGAGAARLYVNGALAASNTAVTITPAAITPARNYLGRSQFAADPLFAGRLDGVLITDTALTATQVAGLMANTAPQFDAATITLPAVARGAALASSLAGRATDADAGDSLTYGKANGPAWLSVAANGTLSGTPTGNDQGPQEFVVTATDSKGSVAYATLLVPLSSLYWRGDANNVWSHSSAGNTNWATDQAGGVDAGGLPTATSDVVFAATTAGNLPAITLGANATARGIRVTSSTGVTLGGSHSLTLGADGFTITPGGGASTISTSGGVVLAANQTWDLAAGLTVSSATSGGAALVKSGSGTLTVTGAAAHTGGTTIAEGTLQVGTGGTTGSLAGNVVTHGTLVVDRSTDLTMSGTISGSGAVVKRSAGRLTLAATSSFAGGATIGSQTGAGIVRATASGALGTGEVLVGPGGNATTARLELAGDVTLANAIALPLRNNASVAIQNISGTNTLSGTIEVAVGGGTGIIQSDAGTLTLGGITSAATGVRTITLQGAGNGTVGGVIANGSGTVGIVKAGTGTWTLGAANTATGDVTISAGTLALAAANRIADAAPLTLGGGTLATGGFSETVGTLTLSANSTIDLGAGASVLSFAGAGTWTAGRTLAVRNWTPGLDHLRIGTGAGLTTAQLAQITINGTAVRQLASGEIKPVGGTDDVWYRLDETSGTALADAAGSGLNAAATGAVSFGPGAVGSAVTLAGGRVELPEGVVGAATSVTIATWVKLDTLATNSRIFDFGTGTTSYLFLTPRSASGTPRFAITTGGGAAEQRIDAAAPLTTGVWTHLAVTIAGGVGTLYVNGAVAGTNASMTLTPASLGFTTNNWLGDSQFAADPALAGSLDEFRIATRALSAAEIQSLATRDVPVSVAAGQTATDGQRSGNVTLVKQGAGTLVLDKANTHTGGTVAAAGTLAIRHVGALGPGGLRVQAGATVTFDVGTAAVPLAALVVEPGGRVDLGRGRLVVAAGGSTTAEVLALLRAGIGDGNWAGTGLTTRFAAPESGLGLGTVTGGDGGTTVAFAAAGDVNLDGEVDILDISLLFGESPFNEAVSRGWSAGDFNYDGVYDVLDVGAMLAANLYDAGSYLAGPAAGTGDPAAASPSVLAAAFATLSETTSSPTVSRRKLFATLP